MTATAALAEPERAPRLIRPKGVPPLFQIRKGKPPRLNLHPGQLKAWNSRARFVAVLAGHQGGKTEFGPHWLAREMQICGPGDYYAVTATYDLFKLKMLPALRGLFTDKLGWNYLAGDQLLVHKGSPTRIILRSAQAEGGLEAGTGLAAWLDECGQDSFKREAWEAIQRRLAVNQGRALMTTTLYNWDWLKTDVYDKWLGGDLDYDVIQFSSSMNPVYPPEEYERQKKLLPPWKFAMTCDGVYSKPAGMIYSDYVDSYAPQGPDGFVDFSSYVPGLHGHLVRPFTIPPTCLRLVGIDFGGSDHTALLWLAENLANGTYYAYRETLGGGLSGKEFASEALDYTKIDLELGMPRETVRLWAGGAKSEDDSRLTWNMAGVPVVLPLITDVEAGIDYVIMLFRQHRLFIMDTLTDLRSQLRNYSRELDAAGEPTMAIEHKDRYHLLDALRAVSSGVPEEPPVQVIAPEPPTDEQARTDYADEMAKLMDRARRGQRDESDGRERGWRIPQL